MDKETKVQLKELLQNYPEVKPGQEAHAWRRLRERCFVPKGVVAEPARPPWNYRSHAWGLGLAGTGVLAALVCFYEVFIPATDNGATGPQIIPANLHSTTSTNAAPVHQKLPNEL